jgi:hypothetical protein
MTGWSAGEMVGTGVNRTVLGKNKDGNLSGRMSGHLLTCFDLGLPVFYSKVFVGSFIHVRILLTYVPVWEPQWLSRCSD